MVTLRSHRLWGCMGLWFLVFQNILHWMDTAGPTQPISVPGQPLLQHRKPWVVFDQMPAKLEASSWPGAAPCFPASRMEDRDVSQPGTRALTWIPLPALCCFPGGAMPAWLRAARAWCQGSRGAAALTQGTKLASCITLCTLN